MYKEGEYKGETPSKSVTRVLVWQQHQHLLGAAFKTTPHTFLASRVGGDIATLREMGAPGTNIWAVEKEREEYRPLLERRKQEGFRLFTRKIELVAASHPEGLRSVYLDYCGNLNGTAGTTRRIVTLMPRDSALSVTLFLGREHERPENREAALLDQIRARTAHSVTVVQSVLYASSSEGSSFGSPMGTWTFYIGPSASRSKMRFDLRGLDHAAIKRLASTPNASADLWRAHLGQSLIRRRAAVKANGTRAAL